MKAALDLNVLTMIQQVNNQKYSRTVVPVPSASSTGTTTSRRGGLFKHEAEAWFSRPPAPEVAHESRPPNICMKEVPGPSWTTPFENGPEQSSFQISEALLF